LATGTGRFAKALADRVAARRLFERFDRLL